MPTANPFQFKGRGNGLENCISLAPLNTPFSSTVMWTTLAGVNSNNPIVDQDKIDESLVLAYKLVYNTYQFKGSCRSFNIVNGITQSDSTANDIVLKKTGAGDDGNNATNPSEPRDRTCNSASNTYITTDQRTRVQASINNSIGIMTHNGETVSNGGQLVGYSVFGNSFSPLCAFLGNRSAGGSANVFLQTVDFDLQNNSLPDDELKNAFVELGGMHFIAKCFSENGSNYTQSERILDPANLLAQSRIQFTGGSGSTQTLDAGSRAQITDIEFYTYS